MAYDESIYRRRETDSTDPVDMGAGATSSFPIGDFGEPERPEDPDDEGRRPAVLDDVFDDPAHGDPGRDRMLIHVLWEVVLLLGVAAVAVLIYWEEPAALRGAALEGLLVSAAALGLITLAAGLTLRAGVPNLALGPVAVAAALHFAEQGDRGAVVALVPAVLAAAALGLVLALFVVGFHVPSWAASLAAALMVGVFIAQRAAPVEVQGEYDPTRHAGYLFGGFAAVAVLGGLLGTVKAVRGAVGRFRPVADPARRRGGAAATLAAGALVLSMGFAALTGVLLAAGGPGTVRPTSGIEWTGLALGAALLAGTSAFGRRGGIFGTVLAAVLLTLFATYAELRDWDIALAAVAAVTVTAGLVVTRMVESFGRSRPPVEDDDEEEEPTSSGAFGWGASRSDGQESWSSALPAQPTDGRSDPWRSDRWSV